MAEIFWNWLMVESSRPSQPSDREGSSSELDPARVLVSLPGSGARAQSLGKAHYSYGFAAHSFLSMFDAAGIASRVIAAPEQYKSELFGQVNGISGERNLHLIFRSSESIRLISGAYNVACFAWEFDALKSEGLPTESVLDNQIQMLRACDEIWTPCHYTQRVLTEHGVDQVQVIPAPISVARSFPEERHRSFASLALFESVPLVTLSSGNEAAFVRLASQHTAPLGSHTRVARALDRGSVFLTVCNPYDQRKNLATLIEGFLMATEGLDDVVLIIKLVTSGQFESPSGFLFHQLRVIFGNPHCLHEESVVLFAGFLAEDEMDALYCTADFYLCTSLGEGQNLPLLEAMARGCVPVSVRNTAMADYINPDNAIVIEEGVYRGMVSGLAADVAGKRLNIPFCDRFQVADAVRTALALDADALGRKRKAAHQAVLTGYSPARVLEMVTAHLSNACPDIDLSPNRTGRPVGVD